MLEKLTFTYSDLTIIAGFCLFVISVYGKFYLDIMKLKAIQEKDKQEIDVKIADIECARKERWAKHDEVQDKKDACLDEIMKGISELRGDVKSIKTHIEYLRKN